MNNIFLRTLYKVFSRNRIKVALLCGGGLGDLIIFCNYAYYFQKKLMNNNLNSNLTMVFKNKEKLIPSLIDNKILLSTAIDLKTYKRNQNYFDLIIDCTISPRIIYANINKIKNLNLDLYKYTTAIDEYSKRLNFRHSKYYLHTKANELEERKFIQRYDIFNFLKIDIKYLYNIPYPDNTERYLKNLGLNNKKFITINTGCDEIYNKHVKLWPINSYSKLVNLINIHFPNLIVVQVGNSGKSILKENKEISLLDMLNKTSLDEVKILIKNSILHIDVEGGLIHLRHGLHGGTSIVLFGPTSMNYFSYPENINIKSNRCDTCCYQLTTLWPQSCPKFPSNDEYSPCMSSISYKTVFNEIEKFIESNIK